MDSIYLRGSHKQRGDIINIGFDAELSISQSSVQDAQYNIYRRARNESDAAHLWDILGIGAKIDFPVK